MEEHELETESCDIKYLEEMGVLDTIPLHLAPHMSCLKSGQEIVLKGES